MLHALLGSGSSIVVIYQHSFQQVQGFRHCQMLIIISDVALKQFLLIFAQDILISQIQIDIVFLHVSVEVFGAQCPGDLFELIVVISAFEEGLSEKDLRHNTSYHSSHHNPQTPYIQGVVIILMPHQQLRPLIVPRADSHIIVLLRQIELAQPPVNNPQLLGLVVDHDILGLNIPVHDA